MLSPVALTSLLIAAQGFNVNLGQFDERFMAAEGIAVENDAKSSAALASAATKTGRRYMASLAGVDFSKKTRSRRVPSVDASLTTCAACVAGSKFWNGIACVDSATIETAFMGLGCFWGTGGHESDCSKMCYSIMTMEMECTSSEDGSNGETVGACVADVSDGITSGSMKMGMPSDLGATLTVNIGGINQTGITTANTEVDYAGFFFYEPFISDENGIKLISLFEVKMSNFQVVNGASNVDDGPLALHMNVEFATIPRGRFSDVASGSLLVTVLQSFVVADAYYFFDKSACPNGVTNASTAGCTPETLLTSSNTYSLNKVSDGATAGFDFRLKAIGGAATVYADTVVVGATSLRAFMMCATPTTGAGLRSPKVTDVCFKFTLLYSGQESWSANLSSAAPASSGTYTCGSYSEVLTLFDNKADARWTGITYADANERLGFRMISASQTGQLSFSEEEDDGDDITSFKDGPLDLALSNDVKVDTADIADTPTCSNTNAAGVVKNQGGFIISPSGSTTTSCGHSSWYDASMQSQLAGFGFTKIRCTFGNFVTVDQPFGILWDPTISTNEDAADRALASKKGEGSSDDGDAALSTGAIIGIVVGGLFLCIVVSVVIMMAMKKNKKNRVSGT